MASVLERNIRALSERRERERRNSPWQERVADAVSRFAGSMTFVFLHLAVFGVWIAVNSGLVKFIPKWDETFVILGTSASVEAIFLSTFILISQNRMTAAADKRADLDLQIGLLSEHEVTKLVALTTAIADRLGVEAANDRELEELQRDVAPGAVLDKIEGQNAAAK
jgi:uncharacterized membrane protein